MDDLRDEKETRVLFQEFHNKGLQYDKGGGQAWRITESNGDRRTMAVFPFKPGRTRVRGEDGVKDGESFIIYTGVDALSDGAIDNIDIQNVEALQFQPQQPKSSVSTQSENTGEVLTKRMFVEDGDVVTTSSRRSIESGNNEVETQDDCYCYQEYEDCEDTNFTCVAKHVTAGVGTTTACYGCAQTLTLAAPACLGCTNAVGASVLFDINCDIGQNCTTKENCVTDEAVGNHIC